MQLRQLGTTGISVSAIAFGCADLVGPSKYDENADPKILIAAALDHGINYFDTAEVYGDGESEAALGRELKSHNRDSVVISSKAMDTHCRREDLLNACENSLRRLQTDFIDLYQVHWRNRETPLTETMAALEKLTQQGKIRAAGVCNFGAEDMADISAIGSVANNQLPWSLLFRAIEYDILPVCSAAQVTITAYCPLMMGLLAGKYSHADQVPEGIARTRHFAHTRPMVKHHQEQGCERETFAAVRELQDLAAEADLALPTMALAWLLHQRDISAVVTGPRTREQAAANAAAGDLRMESELLARIEAVTRPLKEVLGPNADMWRSKSRLV